MSNINKLVKRKIHKEREQPAERKKLGLLEKHKDYKLRANDYHRKENAIRRLQAKAAQKNPDEFYFQMKNSSTKGGIHEVQRGTKRSFDELKTIKHQDLNYLHHKQQVESRKMARLQSELHCFDGKPSNKHVIFFDDAKQIEEFTPEEYFDTAPELVDRQFNRPRKDALQKGIIVSNAPAGTLAKAEKERSKKYRELAARIERKEQIDKTVDKLQQHKNLMTKGPRKKVVVEDKFGEEDPDKTHFVWKQQRKR